MSADAETAELEEMAMLGAYRLMCASVLKQALDDVTRERNLWQRTLRLRTGEPPSPAQEWLERETVGTVTFAEVCDVLGIKPAVARERIERHAHARRRDKPREVGWDVR